MMDVSALAGTICTGLEASAHSKDEAGARVGWARVRLEAEDRLFEQMRGEPIFGVSGYGFNRYVDSATGELRSVTTDGFWTIQLCTRGIAGLAAWVALMLLPVVMFM